MRVLSGALLLVLGVCGSVALASPRWHELDNYDWELFVRDFPEKQHYPAGDVAKTRRSLFEAELSVVRQHNAGQHSWKVGINRMSDWTDQEKQRLNGHRGFSQPGKPSLSSSIKRAPIPASLDWRDHQPSVVSPVKNQGDCGSCWTFATAETVETHFALKYPGKLQALSEQQLASCPLGTNPDDCGGTGGCQGGTIEAAFQSIIKAGGLASEWQYPYTSVFGKDSACDRSVIDPAASIKAVNISSYTKNPSNEYWPLVEAVALTGPQAIVVDASTWHRYETGVYDGCNQTSPVIDHGVQIVGFGTDGALGDYWLIRNSWTPQWGENGYIRLRRIAVNQPSDLRCGVDTQPLTGTGCKGGPKTQQVCGTCGILFDTSYPIIG